MRKIIKNYTFDRTQKKIVFTDYATIQLERIFLITDVSNQTVIYQMNNPLKGGAVSGNELTLEYDTDTNEFANGHSLQIIYDHDEEQDVAVTNDSTPASLVSRIRGIAKILISVWDSTNNWFNMSPKSVVIYTSDQFDSPVTSADATTKKLIRSGSSGKIIYITDLLISVKSAMKVSIVDQDDTLVIPPFHFPTKGGFSRSYRTYPRVATAKSLYFITDVADEVSVQVCGFQK